MQIFSIKTDSDLNAFSENTKLSDSGCVCALGFFDGVHVAHRALISEAKKEAVRLSIPLVIFTFFSQSSLKSGQKRLFTDEEKFTELEGLGADMVTVFNFDLIKNLSKDEFIEDILVQKLNTHTAVSGFNFRFGKGASGNAEYLEKRLAALNRRGIIIPEYKGGDGAVSSTAIKALLSENKLMESAFLLGKPYFIDGAVKHGLGLGKNLGFPTVNMDIPNEKFSLPNGVYYTVLELSGKLFEGLTNVGTCPTFEEREIHTETFILNFEGNVYDESIRLYFIEHLRGEIKFSSAEELIMQINVDKKRALELKKEIQWQEIGLNLQ